MKLTDWLGIIVLASLLIGASVYLFDTRDSSFQPTDDIPSSSDSSDSADSLQMSEDVSISPKKTELCREIDDLTFVPGVLLRDHHTKISFMVPQETVSIINSQDCPSKGYVETEIFLGNDEYIYIDLVQSEYDAFMEWNAGVPLDEIETFPVQIDNVHADATVYDVLKIKDGASIPYGEPFLVVFVDRHDMHYKFQLPFHTEEYKHMADLFLQSIIFQN